MLYVGITETQYLTNYHNTANTASPINPSTDYVGHRWSKAPKGNEK